MPITTTPYLDCVRENGLGITIRELEIRIAHLKTYKEDCDTGGLERTLASLKTQFKQQLSIS
jgi:hypothetical protein